MEDEVKRLRADVDRLARVVLLLIEGIEEQDSTLAASWCRVPLYDAAQEARAILMGDAGGAVDARRDGAREMRERAAAVCRDPSMREQYVMLGPRCVAVIAQRIEALPLPEEDDG